MRKIHPFDLLFPVYRKKLVSRIELAKQARVAPSHVSVVTREAIRSGLLVEHGSAASTGGRRRVLLQVNPDVAQLMGIDIGRTNTGIVVTDFTGRVLAHDWFPTVPSRGREAFLEVLHGEVRSRLLRFEKIAAIGVAHSGVVDSRTGKVLFWPMVDGWKDTPLQQIFEDQYGIRVSVDDRVRAMAIAEEWSGHLAGLRNFILVYVGSGIMSAIFFEGHLYRGRDGLAGELGHTTVVENGETCSCGNQGCLERYSSAAAIVGRVRAELEQGVASVLKQDLKGNRDGLSVETIVAAAKSHDRLGERVLSEAGTYLGTALASVVNLLNPETVILTGRVPQASGELLLTPLRYSLRQRAFPQAINNLPVVVSRLGVEAASVGISQVAGELYFKDCCSAINESPASPPELTRLRTD